MLSMSVTITTTRPGCAPTFDANDIDACGVGGIAVWGVPDFEGGVRSVEPGKRHRAHDAVDLDDEVFRAQVTYGLADAVDHGDVETNQVYACAEGSLRLKCGAAEGGHHRQESKKRAQGQRL